MPTGLPIKKTKRPHVVDETDPVHRMPSRAYPITCHSAHSFPDFLDRIREKDLSS